MLMLLYAVLPLRLIVAVALPLRLVVAAAANTADACPRPCECYYQTGRLTTDCKAQKLTQVPLGISTATMSLQMSDNNLIDLSATNYFFDRGAHQIILLNLNRCGIEQLGSGVFAFMNILERLDLSQNRIAVLKQGFFTGLSGLQRLILSGNRITDLEAKVFQGATIVEEIDLSANLISFISDGAFDGLMKLRSIDLSNNSLYTVHIAPFLSLSRLQLLQLQNNRWRCDCHLRDFVSWQRAKLISEPPKCSTPDRYDGKSWTQLDPNDFACGPEMLVDEELVRLQSVQKGSDVTFKCPLTGDPLPTVQWKMTSANKSTVLSSKPGKITVGNLTQFSDSNKLVYFVTVHNVDDSDSGHYVCIATNAAKTTLELFDLYVVNPSAETLVPTGSSTNSDQSVVVQLHTTRAQLSDELLLILFIAGAVLLVCIVVLLVVCFHRSSARKRQRVPVFTSPNAYNYQMVEGGFQHTPSPTTKAVALGVHESGYAPIDRQTRRQPSPCAHQPTLTMAVAASDGVMLLGDDSGYLESGIESEPSPHGIGAPSSYSSSQGRLPHDGDSLLTAPAAPCRHLSNKAPLAQHDYETAKMPLRETAL